MSAKLTLRLDEELIRAAKAEARRRGKSVSRMVADFFSGLSSTAPEETELPPITASLAGVLEGCRVSKAEYRDYLQEKHA